MPTLRRCRFPQLRDEVWLRQRYEAERKSTTVIAAEIGCSAKLVSEALHALGITARRFAGQNTSGTNWNLRRSLENHAPTEGPAKAPVLTPRAPQPEQSLLVRADGGWVSGPFRTLLVVQPHHSFADLINVALDELVEDLDSTHLVEVWVHPEGRPTKNWWAQPRYTSHHWNEPGMTVLIPDIARVSGDGYPELYASRGLQVREAAEVAVCATLGSGWFAWLRYDLGAENWFGIRAVAPAPDRPETARPEVMASPLGRLDLD